MTRSSRIHGSFVLFMTILQYYEKQRLAEGPNGSKTTVESQAINKKLIWRTQLKLSGMIELRSMTTKYPTTWVR